MLSAPLPARSSLLPPLPGGRRGSSLPSLPPRPGGCGARRGRRPGPGAVLPPVLKAPPASERCEAGQPPRDPIPGTPSPGPLPPFPPFSPEPFRASGAEKFLEELPGAMARGEAGERWPRGLGGGAGVRPAGG